ncbi:MAG TPA: SGNH/GDSL hydrolase family protein [Rugosimonospora sp.]|nr:SGNH/GDSL hydrolase family protein [Rugosimonospora sp.]
MTTFVALGDSVTLGMGDPLPDGNWRGWAALLATGLVAPDFHNLASAGALTGDVERSQLPRALELRPDLAAVVVGVNDTLRGTFDPARIAAAVAHTVGALRAAGAVVLTMRLPDPGLMFGLPGSLARPLARRIRAVNAAADEVSARFGTVHLDMAAHPQTYDRRMWGVDRLHPSERGHRLIAREYHAMLGGTGLRLVGPPDPEPSSAPPTRRAQVRWLATKGTRWLLDRSTDLVPALAGMALREWWHGPGAEPQTLRPFTQIPRTHPADVTAPVTGDRTTEP